MPIIDQNLWPRKKFSYCGQFDLAVDRMSIIQVLATSPQMLTNTTDLSEKYFVEKYFATLGIFLEYYRHINVSKVLDNDPTSGVGRLYTSQCFPHLFIVKGKTFNFLVLIFLFTLFSEFFFHKGSTHKKYRIIWEFFSTWGGVPPISKLLL